METRSRWWNGRWGRLARRDIYLRVDGDRWHLEDRLGGAEGSSDWYDLEDEDAALERIRTQMSTTGGWRAATGCPAGHRAGLARGIHPHRAEPLRPGG